MTDKDPPSASMESDPITDMDIDMYKISITN
jgi:hypothetical protein